MSKFNISSIRRKQLIEATMDCVSDHGINGTTISKISKQAGVSNGVIHHYFHNKDELLEATMRLMLEHLKHDILKRKVSTTTDYECLLAIIEGNFSAKQIEHQSTKIWLSFFSEALQNPDLARLQNVNKKRLKSNLKYHLKQLMTADSAELVAASLAALIDGLWLRGAFDENGIDMKRAVMLCRSYLDLELKTLAC